MKIKITALIMLMGLLLIAGCAKTDEHSTKYDIEQILKDQKIVFIMSVSSFDVRYAAGYFIDGNGKKHVYRLYDRGPFESIELEYAYLMEHYDEFETVDFFDDKILRKCTESLYYVNAESKTKKKGEAICDYPVTKLYGVKMIDGNEEFVLLETFTGILERLVDPSANLIYKEFGDEWYLWKIN